MIINRKVYNLQLIDRLITRKIWFTPKVFYKKQTGNSDVSVQIRIT